VRGENGENPQEKNQLEKHHMLTKDQELATLKETAAKLGPNSYLGPWLDSIAFELEAMMRADSFPCVNLAESEHHAGRIVAQAERKAEQIIANAKRDANDREAAAESRIDRARMLIRDASQNLLAIEERL
jgi:hypothetical protein